MNKPKVISTYGQKFDFDVDTPTEIFIDQIPRYKKPEGTRRIYIALEPNVVSGLTSTIKKFYKAWEIDKVLTYDEDILLDCPVAELFEFGTSWEQPIENSKTDKKFCVSTVCGRKGITENRLIRERLYLRQQEILIPKDFYVSGNEGMEGEKILGDSKLPLLESMFHICIENISQKNWFTEKLIDPIVRKSIPIYIGCPNIDSYFNMDGIIVANNEDEIIKICNALNEKDYYNRIDAVEDNFEKAKKWLDWSKRVEDKVK